MVLGERREPERQFREIDRHRILVDAVETPLRDDATRMENLVFVRRDDRKLVVRVPRAKQNRSELPAGFNEECTRPNSDVTDLEIQDLSRSWIRPELLKDRPKCRSNDRLGERARRVV